MKNFQIVNSELLRGGAPNTKDIVQLKRKYGVNKIISLDAWPGNNINRLCQLLNIEHIIIPVDAFDIESLKYLLRENIFQLFKSNTPVYVHCFHGKDRTGLVVALYRCLIDKWSSKRALKEAKLLKFGTGLDPHIEAFYTKLIIWAGKSNIDHNSANIVDNQKDLVDDYRDFTLDKMPGESWAPYSNAVSPRAFPFAIIDSYDDEQFPSRENYDLKGINFEDHKDYNVFPMVGSPSESAQIINSVGPSLVGGGFI